MTKCCDTSDAKPGFIFSDEQAKHKEFYQIMQTVRERNGWRAAFEKKVFGSKGAN